MCFLRLETPASPTWPEARRFPPRRGRQRSCAGRPPSASAGPGVPPGDHSAPLTSFPRASGPRQMAPSLPQAPALPPPARTTQARSPGPALAWRARRPQEKTGRRGNSRTRSLPGRRGTTMGEPRPNLAATANRGELRLDPPGEPAGEGLSAQRSPPGAWARLSGGGLASPRLAATWSGTPEEGGPRHWGPAAAMNVCSRRCLETTAAYGGGRVRSRGERLCASARRQPQALSLALPASRGGAWRCRARPGNGGTWLPSFLPRKGVCARQGDNPPPLCSCHTCQLSLSRDGSLARPPGAASFASSGLL